MKQRTIVNSGSTADDLHGGDINKKRRRYRGGRVRLVWQTWASKNPTLATLLIVFVCLCLFCMTLEHMHSSSRDQLRHPIRRAKALLQQAAARRHAKEIHGESKDDGDDEEGSGSEDENESGEEGDDRRQRRRHPDADRQGHGNKNKRNKKKRHGNTADDDNKDRHPRRYRESEVQELVEKLDQDVVNNVDGGIRWTAPYLLLPPLVTNGRQLSQAQNDDEEMTRGKKRNEGVNPKQVDTKSIFFKTKQHKSGMKWEEEYSKLKEEDMKPPVDYATHAYKYPELPKELPSVSAKDDGSYPEYPPLRPLGDMMKDWPQDNDFPGARERPIPEALVHFNYSNPVELEMARRFRDAELPFKLYDVPEVTEATQKWTDSYVAEQFDGAGFFRRRKHHGGGDSSALMDRLMGVKPKVGHDKSSQYNAPPPRASGSCQESPNNFFAFFQPNLWDVKTMGLPPVRNNDWTYEHFAEHARYADAVGLNASKPHFYWQSGVPKEERHQPKSEWTFISRDLPSFSSPTETFFVFSPESQKGIQCRFGERGVVAATHYDSGRNMIAMVTGAKRYILAPPKECPSLGIVPWKFNSIFRHSLLNFGHINYMNATSAELDDGEQAAEEHGSGKGHPRQKWKGDHMSQVERQWMDIASSSKAVETVLKAGEVLYIPSHWFHYIVSLQKSAQCNVRSGVHDKGTPAFGGLIDVKTCGRLTPDEAGIRV